MLDKVKLNMLEVLVGEELFEHSKNEYIFVFRNLKKCRFYVADRVSYTLLGKFRYVYTPSVHENYIIVGDSNGEGAINKHGEIVISLKYGSLRPVCEDKYWVFTLTNNLSLYGCINLNENVMIEAKYYSITHLHDDVFITNEVGENLESRGVLIRDWKPTVIAGCNCVARIDSNNISCMTERQSTTAFMNVNSGQKTSTYVSFEFDTKRLDTAYGTLHNGNVEKLVFKENEITVESVRSRGEW